jgi:hypothetical protein
VEHDGDDVGVVPQVGQFVRRVAIVGVDHGEAGLERGEDRLEVLRPVVQVLGDLVLLGDASAQQMGGEGVGALVELTPGSDVAAVALCRSIRQLFGDGLPHLGEVPPSRNHGRESANRRSADKTRSQLSVSSALRPHETRAAKTSTHWPDV